MVVDRRLSLSLVRFGCRHVVSRLSVLFADCRDRLSMKILIVGAQLCLRVYSHCKIYVTEGSFMYLTDCC